MDYWRPMPIRYRALRCSGVGVDRVAGMGETDSTHSIYPTVISRKEPNRDSSGGAG